MQNIRFSKNLSTRGFTLVELLVAVVVSSIAVAGTVGIYQVQQRAALSQEMVVELDMSVGVAANILKRDLRQAGQGYDVPDAAAITIFDGAAGNSDGIQLISAVSGTQSAAITAHGGVGGNFSVNLTTADNIADTITALPASITVVHFLLSMGNQYTLVRTGLSRPFVPMPSNVQFVASATQPLVNGGPAMIERTNSANAGITNFTTGGRATLVNVVSYYISSAGVGETVPSLRRNIHDGTADNGVNFSILDNAEDLQFQFTLQVRGTQLVIQPCQTLLGTTETVYNNIDMTNNVQNACGDFIRGIDMILLARAAFPDITYQNLGYGPYGNRGTVFGVPTDNLRRSMVSLRTKIRNMGVGAEYF